MKVKPFHCPTNHDREGWWRCRTGEWGLEVQSGRFLEKSVVFSGYWSKQCQVWGVRLLKKTIWYQ